MRWQRDWDLISNRIDSISKLLRGYNEGLSVLASFSDVRVKSASNDLPETTREIYRQAYDVHMRLIKFREHDDMLPPLARARLAEVNNELFGHYPNARQRDFKPSYDQTLAFVVSLAAFRSEFSMLLANTEAVQRSIVDRAFFHLQRSIVADDSIAARWQKAFAAGETECEKLGAVHLLAFGIYAFKAHSAGERTDLVLGNSVNPSEAERVAEALVLTEWKRVDASYLASKADAAFNQACIYASSSLAGFELASRRYLVMVSEKRLMMPADRVDGAVTYEFRNVAVAPDPPSRRLIT